MSGAIAVVAIVALSGWAGLPALHAAEAASAADPPPDCRTWVGDDRDQVLPGYFVDDPGAPQTCVPFLASVHRVPAGYAGDFRVEEFTAAKIRARWRACKADAICRARLMPQVLDRLPRADRATRVTGLVDPSGRIDADGAVDLRNIRRPKYFARAGWNEPIAAADPSTFIVEFTVPPDPFEQQQLGRTMPVKLRGWYLEGAGVPLQSGRRVRALVIMLSGGIGQLTAIDDPRDPPWTIDATTGRARATRFPNATTEAKGPAQWRARMRAFHAAGFDVLSYDRRGQGISGGFSDLNTLAQSQDPFDALMQFESGEGLRLLTPAGRALTGRSARGVLLGGRGAREMPVVLYGHSRGSMIAGWAMHRNFVESCTYDQPQIVCSAPLGFQNVRGVILSATFAAGLGYRTDAPDQADRELLAGALAEDYRTVFLPSSEILGGMHRWPAAFFSKGLWDYAESLEGTIDAYRRIRGPRELFVARAAHSGWSEDSHRAVEPRMVDFALALIAGSSTGALTSAPIAPWRNAKELVATSPPSWAPLYQVPP